MRPKSATHQNKSQIGAMTQKEGAKILFTITFAITLAITIAINFFPTILTPGLQLPINNSGIIGG